MTLPLLKKSSQSSYASCRCATSFNFLWLYCPSDSAKSLKHPYFDVTDTCKLSLTYMTEYLTVQPRFRRVSTSDKKIVFPAAKKIPNGIYQYKTNVRTKPQYCKIYPVLHHHNYKIPSKNESNLFTPFI